MVMNKIEMKILEYFKKNPTHGFSTTELVKVVFAPEYVEIRKMLESMDEKKVNIAKRDKARLHRKLLYHLNQLVEENLLQVEDIQGKGEKIFSLSVPEGEIEIDAGSKKVIIHKPSTITTPIDVYEKEGLVRKFRPENWLSKMNALLLESNSFERLEQLESVICEVMHNVNDVICINSFEKFIDEENHKIVEEFITRINELFKDYEIKLSLIINVCNIKREAQVINFFHFLSILNPESIIVIIELDSRKIAESGRILNRIIDYFSEAKIKINIKNNNIHSPPIFYGIAGVYTIQENVWREYIERSRNKIKGLCIAQSSIAIDIARVLEIYKSAGEFRELVLKCGKALFMAEIEKRKSSDSLFVPIHLLNKGYEKDFFIYASSFIRFWNYDWTSEEQKHIFEMLESSKQLIKDFSEEQHKIYESCGMPIPFRIMFSSAFYKFDVNFLSERRYKKTSIYSINDLQTVKIQEYLRMRERLVNIMDKSDRLRIFRGKPIEPSAVVEEISFLLNTFQIPLLSYDFRGIKGEVTLTNFM